MEIICIKIFKNDIMILQKNDLLSLSEDRRMLLKLVKKLCAELREVYLLYGKKKNYFEICKKINDTKNLIKVVENKIKDQNSIIEAFRFGSP
jgi:hypothetical protein